MNRLFNYLEETFMSAAYAEGNDHATARALVGAPDLASQANTGLEDAFAAVGMAEGGLFDEALRLIGMKRTTRRVPFRRFLDEVGLSGAPLRFGIARF